MSHQHTSLRTVCRKPESVDNIIQPRFKDLQQIQTRQTMPPTGNFIIAAELTFQNPRDATSALLGAQLTQIIGFAPTAVSAAAACTAMLTGGEAASVN